MFAWYALVWFFFVIFADPYVSLDDMRQPADNGFVAHIVGRILNTTQGLMVLAELLARRLNSISWAFCRLVVATFALLAMLAPRFCEDVFRLCVTPFMLLLPALTTEVLALAYVATLCTSWLCWYIALVFIGILLPPLLGLVGLFELVYYTSTLSLLAAVWGTVYYEIGRAVYGRLNVQPRTPNGEAHLRRLARRAVRLDAVYHPLQIDLDALIARHQPDVAALLPALSQVDESWLELVQMDEAVLSDYAYHHRKMSARQPLAWGELRQDLLAAAFAGLTSTLDAELSRRPPSAVLHPCSFRHRTAELAGMIFKYILPLPAFKHLHRPFRFRALLPFLVTYPGLLCLPISVPSSYQPDELAEEGLSFSGVLYDFLLASQTSQSSLADEQLAKLLSIHLKTTSARYFAVKAEEKTHEAILDAVLNWRAMRIEVEEARNIRMEEQYEVYEMEDLGSSRMSAQAVGGR